MAERRTPPGIHQSQRESLCLEEPVGVARGKGVEVEEVESHRQGQTGSPPRLGVPRRGVPRHTEKWQRGAAGCFLGPGLDLGETRTPGTAAGLRALQTPTQAARWGVRTAESPTC